MSGWSPGRRCHASSATPGARPVVESTALMDFGFAEGREDALARLLGYLVGVMETLGRVQLMAPLEFLPSVREHLEDYEPGTETRALYWQSDATLKKLGVTKLTRPYTDLAYW